jgi:hemoglobin
MKKDILTKKDIEKLVNHFYEKVKNDEFISRFFRDDFNWKIHLQTMCDFWENVVFYTGSYNGNPMQKHFDIHEKQNFTEKDFNQWTKLFNNSVDELFEGENVNIIKQKAQSIATIMQIKMFK